MSTSLPHVGVVGVSVATASARKSDGKVGNVSCTEQPQPWRFAVVRLANCAEFESSATEPPQGGPPFSVQSGVGSM